MKCEKCGAEDTQPEARRIEPEPVPFFGQPEALLHFLKAAASGEVTGDIGQWSQFRLACRWAVEQIEGKAQAMELLQECRGCDLQYGRSEGANVPEGKTVADLVDDFLTERNYEQRRKQEGLMPTGYTATLMEKGQDFRSFVLTCARGMGACIMQRDDPIDKPPAKQKPGDYNAKALAAAEKLHAKLTGMSPAKQLAYGEELRSEAVASAMHGHAREREQEARLERMAAQVQAWEPPTDDHQGLKKFMLEQIQVSKHGDWMAKYVKEAQDKTPEAYFVEALSKAARDIKYHAEEHAKEVARTNERNDWIDRLYKSLPR